MKTLNPGSIKADSHTSNKVLLLKHVTYLRLTNQIRTLFYYTQINKKILQLIIPYDCELSWELRNFINKHSDSFKISKET
jgi:hypothetical protein